MRSTLVVAFTIGITVAAYTLSRAVASRWRSPLTTPVFFSTPLVVAALALAGLGLEDYRRGKELIGAFLGPATVALAVPLYRNRRAIRDCGLPALAGLVAGSVSTLVAAVLLARAFGLPRKVAASIGIKSVTAPVAAELATFVGGDATLAVGFVIATGMLGAMIGPALLDRLHVRRPLARGLALGAISHGQGTAQAVLEGELQGAAASVAMGLAAVVTSLAAPRVIPLLVP